jgi:SWI/SNF-related matrix-associated actin-dependent regulator of chromatin subfamily A protein 2/4
MPQCATEVLSLARFGAGKTIQTIALLAYLMEMKGNYGPHLVVVPLSTISNWSLEFQRWAPNIQVVVFKGSVSERKHAEAQMDGQKFNVLLSTYEYVMKEKKVLSKPHWSYIVVDEGHRMKNSKSKLATTFHKHYKSKHRLMLTGTPLQNNLTELWSLLNFLLPTIFDSSDNFEQWFNAPFSAGGEAIGPSQEETLLVIDRLHQVLRPFLLRRLKKEVEAQLPDKVELMIKCDMSEWQKLLYAQVRQKALVSIDARTGSTKTKGLNNTLMHLRTVCNHPFLMYESYHSDEGRESELWRAAGKFEVLHRMLPKLRATGHRVLLFSQFTSTLDVLEEYCDHVKLSHLRLDGQTMTDRRGELLQLFNAEDSPYFIFLLSTRAGGLGLNLQTADTVIIFDSDWNPQADLQAQDRAHRIGQRNTVRIFRLITAGTVEESILARANEKLAMDAQIIQAGKFNLTSTHQERKTMLESILTKEAASDKDEITDDSLLNSMIARDQDEFERFERMDEQQSSALSLPRLMQFDELPLFIREEVAKSSQPEVQDLKLYGRGAREKVIVDYSEEMSQGGALFVEEDAETPEPKKRRHAVKLAEAPTHKASESAPEPMRKGKRKFGADAVVETRNDAPERTPSSAKRLTRAATASTPDSPPKRKDESDTNHRSRKLLEAEPGESSDISTQVKRSRGRPKKS